ncbi:MAG: tetratricopeptide repeat protein [Caldilineaceae bacterium]|nr:tetratricopeptide repeat protein [Caldilineaceae bacterium]
MTGSFANPRTFFANANLRRVAWALVVLAIVLLARLMAANASVPQSAPAPAAVEYNPYAEIVRLQTRLIAFPDDADAYAGLGLAYLQQVREDGDAAHYQQAETALQAALERQPSQVNALVGMGMLALARHDFAAAIPWAEQALAVAPYRAEAIGVLVDANVELGRYKEALEMGQAMINLRPGIGSYSRAAYLRELNGDTDGAVEAMELALGVAVPDTEGWRWTAVQLGHLYFNRGDWTQADVYYQAALQSHPAYPFALAARGRVAAAQGDIQTAIGFYAQALDRLPLPEFAIPLGDLYTLANQPEKAAEQYGLVGVIQQLNRAAGMAVDMELALFEADYGDPATALTLARQAYAARPSIHAADVLAWALHCNGQDAEAQPYSAESLRLGTQDALLHYHAGVIAQALGDREMARQHLQTALDINPAFSILHADDARQRLHTLR